MKKFLALTALFVLLSAVTALAAPYTITVTHIVDEAHSWHRACEFFKQEVEKRSDGKIEVKIYPNSQLGNEIDTIQSALTGGGVDVVITGESMMKFDAYLTDRKGEVLSPISLSESNRMRMTLSSFTASTEVILAPIRCFLSSMQKAGGFTGYSKVSSVRWTLAAPLREDMKRDTRPSRVRRVKTASSLEGM